MARGLALAAAVLAALGLAAGCSGGGDGAIQVTGVVLNADGTPIKCESGMILFTPAGAGQNATGGVEPDGTFTMMTKVQGDGVQPGTYKVVLQMWKSYREQTLAVPQIYGDPSTTPLEATVDGDHSQFEFKVEPET